MAAAISGVLGDSPTKGALASMSKKMAPVRRTARSTSERTSIGYRHEYGLAWCQRLFRTTGQDKRTIDHWLQAPLRLASRTELAMTGDSHGYAFPGRATLRRAVAGLFEACCLVRSRQPVLH